MTVNLFQLINSKISKIRISSLILMSVLSLSYLIFRLFLITPVFSDENIYINMAKAVKDGLLPYKDFFYAHPPIQLFLFQPVLYIFGINFIVVKIFMTIIGIGNAILTYLIAKKIFGGSVALLSFLFFLFFPGFLIFSNQAMGMFEALLFFLLGFYFLIKKQLIFSSVLFSLSIFTRYMSILLLPFLFYYMIQFDRKNLIRFIKFLSLTIFLMGVVFIILFGKNFLIDTFFYHIQSNISIKIGLSQWLGQYFNLGFFTIFLSLVSLLFAVIKKERKIFIFAIISLIYDFLVLFSLKTVIYHYFILPLPFLFISMGATFIRSKDFIVKASIITIFTFSIIANLSNIIFYFDKTNNEIFSRLVNYVEENLEKNDFIFGEPRTTNYLSFVTDIKIVNNYFDSDMKFINFAGEEKIFSQVDKAEPRIIIIDNNFNYIQNLKNKYYYISKWEIPNYYSLTLYKLLE